MYVRPKVFNSTISTPKGLGGTRTRRKDVKSVITSTVSKSREAKMAIMKARGTEKLGFVDNENRRNMASQDGDTEEESRKR